MQLSKLQLGSRRKGSGNGVKPNQVNQIKTTLKKPSPIQIEVKNAGSSKKVKKQIAQETGEDFILSTDKKLEMEASSEIETSGQVNEEMKMKEAVNDESMGLAESGQISTMEEQEDKILTKNKCKECGESFKHHLQLKKHKKNMHEIGLPYSCTSCNEGFTQETQLKKHVQQKHKDLTLGDIGVSEPKEEIFNCEHCDFKTAKIAFIRTHNKFMHKGA